MSNVSPCMNCQERSVGCHSRCQMYKEWQERKQARHDVIMAEKIKYGIDCQQKRKTLIRNALKRKGR